MPLLGAPQTPTALSAGERVAVLNGENLNEGALTMAVSFTPQATPIELAIYNNTGETVALYASPNLTQANFLPVSSDGTPVTAATDTVTLVRVASGLYYAIEATAAITDGTIWLAR